MKIILRNRPEFLQDILVKLIFLFQDDRVALNSPNCIETIKELDKRVQINFITKF